MDYTSIFTLMRAEVTLTAILVFVFLYDLMAGERARRRFSAVVCCLMVVQVVVNLVPAAGGELFGGMFCHTPMDGIVKSMLSVGALIVFLQSDTWLRREDTRHKQGEFYILTLSTLLGMYFMIGAGNFLLFFIGLELASVPMACLVAFDKYKRYSAEAGAKYILCALFSSGLMLYGISFLYGTTGTLYFGDMAARIDGSPLLVMALVFFLSGLGFKISLVPFHLWTADAYQGAPTNVTAYLSVVSKGAAAFVLLTVLVKVFAPMTEQWQTLPWIVTVYVASFLLGGLYSVLWKYAGERDLLRLAVMVAVPTGIVYAVNRRCIHGVLFNSANCMAAVLILLLVGGSRLAWRLFLNHPIGERLRGVPNKDPNRPVMIVGAGEAGAWAINVCKTNKQYGRPVLAVDDDPAKLHQTIHGVPVKGTLEQIPQLCTQYNIHNIIIAIPTLRGSRLNHVIDLCVSTHCAVQMLSDPQLVGSNGPQQGAFRELNTADFLSRDEVTLDNEKISGYLTGKTVLVTGGGGSIGSELCRQVMRFRPGKLLIFDIYENCAYELLMELQQKYGRDIPVTVLIGSIRDKKRLDEVFETYHPTVVFHAAAHKHVPLMEISPAEAVKNNVLGTKNLLTSASEHDVERFVQLSTDKAVNPTSVMGCTKRICEMLIQTFAGNTDMKCVAVRFGNVLGSHGSVIPLFEAQIKKGGPVTLTDPNIERYFMTIPEAAQLVLQAGALAEGGSIYVLDMGEPVKIMDLAKQLIRFYGYEPGVNMEIKIVGLRPGEKLYEELMMDEEQGKMRRTEHNKIFVASPRDIDLAVFYQQLQDLAAAAQHNDEGVVDQLEKMIPTFTPTRKNLKT